MRRRRRFSGDLKAKVALEALRGDRTLQEISSKQQVHPNQVSTWKRQAIEGLGEVFSNGVDRRRRDHENGRAHTAEKICSGKNCNLSIIALCIALIGTQSYPMLRIEHPASITQSDYCVPSRKVKIFGRAADP